MESDRFDSLARSLHDATSRRHVVATFLGGTLGLLDLVDSAAKKNGKGKKNKRKNKKRTCKGSTKNCGKTCIPSTSCCTTADCDDDERCQNGACTTTCAPQCGGKECGPDGCGRSCGSCSGEESCQNGTCSTTTCVPESAAATCGGRCGTWNNNCGQAVTCPACSGSQACLDNGSCATPCPPGTYCDAGNICYCSADTEGAGYCRQQPGSCAAVPDTCTETADCQPGWACMPVNCPPNVENRCLPLCAL